MRYIDPTGHNWEDCGDKSGYRCQIHMKHVAGAKAKWATEIAQILAATVKLGFGDASCVDKPGPGCSFGLGTVVGDRQTIYTAFHVYDDATIGKIFLYQTRDGRYHAMSGVTWSHPWGSDVMILHLPVALGSDFVPAKINKDYVPSAGDNVYVAYKDDLSDYSGLHVLPTSIRMRNISQPGQYANNWPVGTSVYDPKDLNTTNKYQMIVNKGDSGGGVFYNGDFVGVSSYVHDDDGYGPYMVFERP